MLAVVVWQSNCVVCTHQTLLLSSVVMTVMVIYRDVHHCKGTAEIFAEDPNVLVFSLHRYGR